MKRDHVSGCTGKRSYPTFQLADKGSRRARAGGRMTSPYHCSYCNQYHTGQRMTNPVKLLVKKRTAKRLADAGDDA